MKMAGTGATFSSTRGVQRVLETSLAVIQPYIRLLYGEQHCHSEIIYKVSCTFSFFYSALNSNLHNGILM
jgi:hypothetical protein